MDGTLNITYYSSSSSLRYELYITQVDIAMRLNFRYIVLPGYIVLFVIEISSKLISSL